MRPDLAGRIATVRLRLGLTQTAFAARIGVPRNMVVRYEHQVRRPKAETLDRIARVGGVSVEWLLQAPAAPHLRIPAKLNTQIGPS
jgi:transcriptional regulator with XRE-family HTH domain